MVILLIVRVLTRYGDNIKKKSAILTFHVNINFLIVKIRRKREAA